MNGNVRLESTAGVGTPQHELVFAFKVGSAPHVNNVALGRYGRTRRNVWRYAGVRPLYDDGASSATAATRDYVLSLDDDGAPLLNVFGGKITTYRRLAEAALDKLGIDGHWTAGAALPGGDFAWNGANALAAGLVRDCPFLTNAWAARLVRCYGTDARAIMGDAHTASDLGQAFGATLTEAELTWLADKEFARTGQDAIWRRTKLGLRLTKDEAAAVEMWFTLRKDSA